MADQTNKAPLSIAIVTYGDVQRLQHFTAAYQAACAYTKSHVTVIANGVTGEYYSALSSLIGGVARSTLVRLSSNLGSQGGFERAMHEAHTSNPGSPCLLLDDDNVVTEESIDLALSDLHELGPLNVIAFAKRRRSASGMTDPPAKLPRSTFLNFDLGSAVMRRLRTPVDVPSQAPTSLVPVHYAPYGGLLLSADSLGMLLTVPAPTYVVYEDDIFLTSALVDRGYSVWYSGRSYVEDLTEVWHDPAGKKAGRLKTLALGAPGFRSFYYVRNRAHFEKHHWQTGRARYRMNKVIVLAYISLMAFRAGNFRQWSFLIKAISAGERSRLGVDPSYPLP